MYILCVCACVRACVCAYVCTRLIVYVHVCVCMCVYVYVYVVWLRLIAALIDSSRKLLSDTAASKQGEGLQDILAQEHL